MSFLGKVIIAVLLGLTLLLFVLKVAQVGLAASWGWELVFLPIWLPVLAMALLRGLVFIEANRPNGRR